MSSQEQPRIYTTELEPEQRDMSASNDSLTRGNEMRQILEGAEDGSSILTLDDDDFRSAKELGSRLDKQPEQRLELDDITSEQARAIVSRLDSDTLHRLAESLPKDGIIVETASDKDLNTFITVVEEVTGKKIPGNVSYVDYVYHIIHQSRELI